MQSNRSYYTRKKPILVLSGNFNVSSDIKLGETGQLLIEGIITRERIEELGDYKRRIIKTVYVNKANKIKSIYINDAEIIKG